MRQLSRWIIGSMMAAALSCAGEEDDLDIVDEPGYSLPSCANGSGKYDSDSELCWLDPPVDQPMNWGAAIAYCNDLDLGGFNDWRLPNIQELLSLVHGCDQSECELIDPECLSFRCTLKCNYSPGGNGPGKNGCYWDVSLSGACCHLDESLNGKCSYTQGWWSSSTYADDVSAAFAVDFKTGGTHAYGKEAGSNPDYVGTIYVRCVRNGR